MLKRFLLAILLLPLLLLGSAGKISTMEGEIHIIRASSEIKAKNGSEIEQKDTIKSIGNSKAQLQFTDSTVVTIGKNTTFKVEEYFYEEGNPASKAKFGAGNGVFKAITGQVGKVAKENFEIKTKTATMGIRGTHLFGEVTDELEKFGCTKGAIFIQANGAIVDVPAGYVTEVKPGFAPSTPRKIEGGDMKLTSSALKDSLKQIGDIKDPDARNALLNALENLLNQAFEASLGKSLAINQSFNDGYKGEGEYKPLEWGFYTPASDSQVIVKNGSSYVVNNKSYTSLIDAYNSVLPVSSQITANKDGTYSVGGQSYPFLSIAIANTITSYKFVIPIEKVQGGGAYANSVTSSGSKFLVLNDKGTVEEYRQSIVDTPEAVIKGFMGTPTGQTTAYESWDGRAGSKTVVEYKGSSIGSVSYPNQNLKNSLIDTANNSTYLVFDFGNRYLSGYINFIAVDPKTSKSEAWQMQIASIGKTTIQTTGFFVDNGYYGAGPLASSLGCSPSGCGFFNRYSGPTANEVSGFFEFISNAGTNTIDDKVAYGLFVAGKTNSFQLNKQEVGSNDYFSWGYWAKGSIGDKSDKAVLAATPMGSYVMPKLDETTKDVIDGYSANSIKASYAGNVIGTVSYPIDGKPTDLMKNGTAALNFDFKAKTVGGGVAFDAGSDKWSMGIQKSLIDGNGFVFVGNGSINKTESVDTLNGNGKFFGKNADAVGGGFNASSNSGKIAIGSFAATKK